MQQQSLDLSESYSSPFKDYFVLTPLDQKDPGQHQDVFPKCEVCDYAKALRKSTKGAKQSTNQLTDCSLKPDNLHSGMTVLVDHLEPCLEGCTLTSFGKTTSPTCMGGCVLIDHMSR